MRLQRTLPAAATLDRDGWGPASYTAAHNPTGAPFETLWRSEGHATATEALTALAEHLGASQ